MATTNDRPRNTDYDRFLLGARGHAAHIGRIAKRLLDEGRIALGQHDAIATAVSELLHDAYLHDRASGRSVPVPTRSPVVRGSGQCLSCARAWRRRSRSA